MLLRSLIQPSRTNPLKRQQKRHKSYLSHFEKSLAEKEAFWSSAAKELHWFEPWQETLDNSNPPFTKWFKGGKMNTCYNALDVHVNQGRGNDVAMVWDSPFSGLKRELTFSEMLGEVKKFAGVLKGLGVQKGDVVVIYMPMIPEAAVAMLACARIGAVHSVVFGGFAPMQLAARINHSKPKAIIYASCGYTPKGTIPYKPLIDSALEIASHQVDHRIIFQRPEHVEKITSDVDWKTAVSQVEDAPVTVLDSNDPLYIIYTSGTTGDPKGIVRDNAGYNVALKWSLSHIFNINPGDAFWAASDIGWVVGHSYCVYGPLIAGATSVMYEGKPVGTPDASAFWRVISENKVKSFFVAPTAIRAIKKEDPEGKMIKKFDMSCLESFFVAGERCDPDTVMYLERILEGKIPVIDNWWQTETGWPIASNFVRIETFPTKYGSVTKPVPGWDVKILDDDNNILKPGQYGSICAKLPLPPGALTTLYKNEERFKEVYFSQHPGYYYTGDYGYMDEENYLHIMARTDDVINVSGVRLSTGAIEEIISSNQKVAECAVIGPNDDFKGQIPVGLIVLKDGVTQNHEEIIKDLILDVRNKLGAIANFNKVQIVSALPKTRSGKTLRGAMKKLADGETLTMPPTIEDDATLQIIVEALIAMNLPASMDLIKH